MGRTFWVWMLAGTALTASCSSSGSPTGSSSGTSTSTSSGTGAGGSGTTASSSTAGTGGAACAACIKVLELTPGSRPYGIFVDDTNIYWTHFAGGEVMQAKLDGSNPVTLTTGEIAPIAVQAMDGFVYWVSYSETGVVRKAPIGGGDILDLGPAPAARELFVGSGGVWWTGEPDDLWRVPLTGLPDGGVPDLLSANTLPNGLALDELNIYWVNRFDGLKGYVKKSNYDFKGETVLAIGDIPWDIAVDDKAIYWTEQGSGEGAGKVMKAAKADGSGAKVLATDPAGPQGLTIDATHVYWTNKNDGTIKSVPLEGGPVTVLATGQCEPANVVVDDDFVYWTNFCDDTIIKVAK